MLWPGTAGLSVETLHLGSAPALCADLVNNIQRGTLRSPLRVFPSFHLYLPWDAISLLRWWLYRFDILYLSSLSLYFSANPRYSLFPCIWFSFLWLGIPLCFILFSWWFMFVYVSYPVLCFAFSCILFHWFYFVFLIVCILVMAGAVIWCSCYLSPSHLCFTHLFCWSWCGGLFHPRARLHWPFHCPRLYVVGWGAFVHLPMR